MSESGVSMIAAGRVANPSNGVDDLNSSFSRLSLEGLLGNPYAHYQVKFQETLPSGTAVYLRVAGGGTSGILNLLLASNGGISVQKNASYTNEEQISGSNIESHFLSDTIISGEYFVKVRPLEEFNAITVSLTPAGLSLIGIDVLTFGYIDVYYAYYECPSINVSQQGPACAGQPFTLAVDNPINSNYTWYPANSTANPLGTGNTITLTEVSPTTKNYYLKHNQFSATCGLDTVTVSIGATPDNPAVSLE